MEVQQLTALANDYGDDLVIRAIDISINNGKRSIAYITGVANNLATREGETNGRIGNDHGQAQEEVPVAGSKYKYIEG